MSGMPVVLIKVNGKVLIAPMIRPDMKIPAVHCTILFVLLLAAGCKSSPPSERMPEGEARFERLNQDGTRYTGTGDFGRQPWACVRDRVTGLVWEVKQGDGGLHDADHTYTWYDPDPRRNKGAEGKRDGGQCRGSACDTLAFIEAVNAAGWCGFNDWRLPDQAEIASINDRHRRYPGPTQDPAFFPNARADQYWTSETHLYYPGAWAWNFAYGHNQVDWKTNAKRVRLVRGEVKTRLARPED